jgi:outer membrane autotransporter protein
MATSTQSLVLGQATLTALGGQNYSSFSSSMVQGAQLFMNNFANRTGGSSPASNRVALAEACDIACDVASPAVWGAWGGALGGLGTIGSGANMGAVTYNVGGFAAGLDRLVAPGLRVGVTTGYTTGTQWTSGFTGTGMTDTFLAGLYGGYRMDKVYADAVVGYAYSYNQMWRQIFIPGLQQRTAQGRTGANQWYGQVEGGYRFDIGTAADAYITPFARLQGYTGAQNGFTETGAQSLNLTVAGQTTNSLRSVIGAQLGGTIDLGWREKLGLQFRLGWSHEYAATARPVTATLSGAPLSPFTAYGIAPTRDGAVVGFSANTAIADGTSMYLRYEGNISGEDSAHALTAGVRMTW